MRDRAPGILRSGLTEGHGIECEARDPPPIQKCHYTLSAGSGVCEQTDGWGETLQQAWLGLHEVEFLPAEWGLQRNS
jgi:hypothetical protein